MGQYQRIYQIDYLCGWRYLLSPKFRNQAREKWGRNRLLQSVFLVGSFTSIMLTSAAAVLLLMAVLHLSG